MCIVVHYVTILIAFPTFTDDTGIIFMGTVPAQAKAGAVH